MISITKPFSETLLDELEKECHHFLNTLGKYRSLPEGDERDTVYGYLTALLTNLEGTAQDTRDQIDKELDELPDDE
jgi:hypothetical protein